MEPIPNLICAIATTLAAFAATPALAQAPTSAAEPPTIVTGGEAIVRRAPDVAFLTVSVETRARNPKDAQAQNATIMVAVQQRILAAGLARDALRTLGYSVQQEFDFANGRRVPRDFVASNAVEIRIEAVERAGEIIDAAVQAGATSVSNVRFDLRDRAGVEREALRLAVVDARARADAAAAGVGRTVDRVLKIDDSRQPSPSPQPYMAVRGMATASDAVAPPVEPGAIEIRSQVTLTVSMK